MFDWLKKLFYKKEEEKPEGVNEGLTPEDNRKLDAFVNGLLKDSDNPFFKKVKEVFMGLSAEDFKLALVRINSAASDPGTVEKDPTITTSSAYTVGISDGMAIISGMMKLSMLDSDFDSEHKCYVIGMKTLTFDEYYGVAVYVDEKLYDKSVAVTLFDFENGNIIVQTDSEEEFSPASIVKVVYEGTVLFEGSRVDRTNVDDDGKVDQFTPKKNIPKYNN
jgi:hypothetical protein